MPRSRRSSAVERLSSRAHVVGAEDQSHAAERRVGQVDVHVRVGETTRQAAGGGVLGALLSLGTQATMTATDTPDTRSWSTLPARIAFEPEVARCAALHATAGQVAEMRSCMLKAQQAPTWRQYEQWDNRLHRTIGEASQNSLLLGLLDTLNAVRRAVTWGRLRDTPLRPPADHHSFEEHARIVAAIADRDGAGAADAMRRHLRSVESHMRDRL